MIEAFVKRPAMTIVFILVFVIMGLVSYNNLIQERTPKVEFPIVSVQLVYPGASPIEIESQMVKKVEDAVSEISEIKKITSYVYENFARVMIEFQLTADVNIKSIEVKDKVEAITNDFPDSAEKPVIAKFDPLMTSVLDLVLQSTKHNDVELYEYADKVLKNKLTVVPGVASVDISGGKIRQVNVFVDNNLLVKNYLTINDVIQVIQAENINIPGGSIRNEGSKTGLRFVGEFDNVEKLKDLALTSREGKVFKLSEIAQIEDSFKKVEKISRFNGKNSVVLSLMKLSDGSAVDIAKHVQQKLESFNSTLPEGMSLQLGFDSTEYIIKDNQGTISNIMQGIVLTVIILLVFLGDIRTAFISVLVIPSSIISSVLLMDKFGFSLNMMTLLAFGTALGTLIANALVVIEAVYAHLEKGKDSVSAAIDGTKEVIISVIASSGTNLVVFTPIAFMGGIVGRFFLQFGMTVVFATIFSIIASLTLTPMLCAVLLKPKQEGAKLHFFDHVKNFVDRLLKRITDWYKRPYALIVRYPITATILSVLLFVASFYPVRYVGFAFIPSSDEDSISISITMPEGTPVEKTESVVKIVEAMVSATPEVKDYLSVIGKDGEQNASIVAKLVSKDDRKRDDMSIIKEWTPKVAEIPEAVFTLARSSSKGGSGDVTLDIYADDYDTLVDLSLQVKKIMAGSGYFRSITSTYRTPSDEFQFIPNQSAMIEQGVKNATLGMTLRNLINGNDQNKYKEKGEEYDINVELMQLQKEDEVDFERFNIWGKDGLISLGRLGSFDKEKSVPPIRRRDKRRVIELDTYLAKSTPGQVMSYLKQEMTHIKFPPGSGYFFAGSNEMMQESNQEIGKAFILAVILTYLLLVAVLNSFLLPLSIGTTILTSYLGCFLILFYFEISINIASMMAFVMLVGLTVNNAILVIDYALQQLAKGMAPVDAFWEGVEVKFKTVLMTTIAIIAGTLPQFFDVDVMKASMGAVIIGGMFGSVLFTYTIVPSTFVLIYKYKGAKIRLPRFKKKHA